MSKEWLIKAVCKKCNKEFIQKVWYINYCSNICLYSRNHSNYTKNKISNSLKVFWNKTKTERNNKKIIDYNLHNTKRCIYCKWIISYKFRNRKTCSNKCLSQYRSILREKTILEKWTNNFSTKVIDIEYKWKKYKCDSKLEIAWIIYLDLVKKITDIERFKSILTFNDNDTVRRFNPDFIWKKWNKKYIIEVKMEWSKNSVHKYNKFIPEKKRSLQLYCQKYWYIMIWLDFSYDNKLRKIYHYILKQKQLNFNSINYKTSRLN